MNKMITKEELMNMYSKVVSDDVSKEVSNKLPECIKSLILIMCQKTQELVNDNKYKSLQKI